MTRDSAIPCTCIVLAAGMARRMGRPKLFLEIDEVPVLLRVLSRVVPLFERTLVVEGAYPVQPLMRTDFADVPVVQNERYREGQLGSLKEGLRHVPPGPVFVMLGDLCLIRESTFRTIWDGFKGEEAAFPVQGKKRGHPVVLGEQAQTLVLKADNGERAMHVIAGLNPAAVPVADPGIYQDIDTPADLERIRRFESLL